MVTRTKQLAFDLKTIVMQRDVRRAARRLGEAEHADPAAVRDDALAAAMGLARHAFRTSPFYRDGYSRAGLDERDLEDPETFAHLPILEKADLRQHGERLRSTAARPRDALIARTGGSTGEPLQVYNDRTAPTAAMWWRVYRWWGVSPADDVAFFYRQSRTARKELLHRVEWWPTRHLVLNARGMNETNMRAFSATLCRVRPALVQGYAHAMTEFAEHCRRTGDRLPRPVAVSVTAAPLTPLQRERIEGSFRSPVYDAYRSTEVPWIAAQCAARDGLHVLGDLRIVECVDEHGKPAKPGQVGDVLVTDLVNRVQPILRYRLGDRSALRDTQCACGMALPVMEAVEGRISDVVRAPSGRAITGGLSGLFLRWPSAIRQFQIVQDRDYRVTVVVVPGWSSAAAEDAVTLVAREVSSMLGDEVPVDWTLVDAIAHDGGKSRLVLSRLTEG